MNLRLIAKIAAFSSLSFGMAQSAIADEKDFSTSINLLAPIVLTKTQDLTFPNASAEFVDSVLVAANDSTAAIFSATGEANRAVTGSITASSIEMIHTVDSSHKIIVDSFTTGGDMNSSGVTAFDNSGNLSNLRVGATANIEADDIAGNYAGSATFRLSYQ